MFESIQAQPLKVVAPKSEIRPAGREMGGVERIKAKAKEWSIKGKEWFKKLGKQSDKDPRRVVLTIAESDRKVLGSEFTDAVHTDEAERKIVEKTYDCWETVPINTGTIQVECAYRESPEKINTKLQNLKDEGVKYLLKPSESYGMQVGYEIPLSNIKIPEKFPLSYLVTMDKITDYLVFYEGLNVPQEVILPSLQELAEKSSRSLNIAISYLKSIDPNAPFPKTYDENNEVENSSEKCLNNVGRFNTMSLGESYPEIELNKPSKLIREVRKSILEYMESKPDNDKYNEVRHLLEREDLGEDQGDEITLTPNPAIYHDNIEDSRFGSNGLKADIVTGDIISESPTGDIDASAAENLIRKIKSAMNSFTSVVGNDEIIYTPPNMTNLYLIHIPVLTNSIYEGQKDLRASYKNSFVPLLICNDVSRLNPEIVGLLDERWGNNGYILATTDPNISELKRVLLKPKEDWKITSKKPRINIPLNFS